ncbi:MAG: hypothetical protein KDK78_05175, partial [Chlamydiia bacterium]|nr:hypothetical protein [Chlamydiia bacterium]
ADMDFRGGALVAQTASWFELNDRYEFCTSGIVNENVTSKSRQEYAGGFNGNLDQLGKKLVDILFASLPEGAAVLVNDEQKKVHIESGHILFV